MKPKYLVILVLILLLLTQSFAQRGGGGRTRSRSSRSRNKSGGSKGYEGFTLIAILIYVLYQFVIWIYTLLRDIYRWLKYGSNQFRRIADNYVKKYGFIVCRSSQRRLMQRLEQFVKKTWKITFQSSYSLKKIFDFKIDQYTKKSDYIYEFKGTGNNQMLGSSKINGIILFHNEEFHLCFQKIYDDKQNAGQQGSWGMLIYEIQEKANGYFSGIWFYENFETHPSYSGRTEMSEAFDNKKSTPKEYVPTTFFL